MLGINPQIDAGQGSPVGRKESQEQGKKRQHFFGGMWQGQTAFFTTRKGKKIGKGLDLPYFSMDISQKTGRPPNRSL